MSTTLDTLKPDVDAYIQRLIDEASAQRLPGLFADETIDAIYRLHNRNGISVIAVRTTQLTEEYLLQIMSFRFGQYLAAGYLNTELIHDQRLKNEPLSGVSAGDIHVIAASAETGEILCYAVIVSCLAHLPAYACARPADHCFISRRPLAKAPSVVWSSCRIWLSHRFANLAGLSRTSRKACMTSSLCGLQ